MGWPAIAATHGRGVGRSGGYGIMAHYCDSKMLEKNWFNWLMAEATPSLDVYRSKGVLMSKVLQIDVNSKKEDKAPNPYWGWPNNPARSHCILTQNPVYFISENDKPKNIHHFGSKTNRTLPAIDTIDKTAINDNIVSELLERGYVLEKPIKESWDAMLIDIKQVCTGISLKINLPSDEAHDDLASEAFLQVVRKIKTKKLIFTPGLAPVFNLVTTTVHRLIFSLLNKATCNRVNKANHMQMMVPFATSGLTRGKSRIVTKRIYGSVVAYNS